MQHKTESRRSVTYVCVRPLILFTSTIAKERTSKSPISFQNNPLLEAAIVCQLDKVIQLPLWSQTDKQKDLTSMFIYCIAIDNIMKSIFGGLKYVPLFKYYERCTFQSQIIFPENNLRLSVVSVQTFGLNL